MENDVVSHTDHYYSNGVEVERELDDENYITAGHKIFTPDDKRETALIPTDRPYAGHLYTAYGSRYRTPERTDTLEYTVGTVGPRAAGEHVQNEFHKLIGDREAAGWDNQIGNEFTANARGRRTYHLWPETPWGINAFLELSAGNVLTAANVGAETAWRYDRGNMWGSIFLGTEGLAKLRDIFLDGNTFKRSHSVDKRPFVAALIGGACIGYKKAFVGYVLRTMSRDFDGQPTGHSFGSIRFGFGRCE